MSSSESNFLRNESEEDLADLKFVLEAMNLLLALITCCVWVFLVFRFVMGLLYIDLLMSGAKAVVQTGAVANRMCVRAVRGLNFLLIVSD
jgi:hypothetical protein